MTLRLQLIAQQQHTVILHQAAASLQCPWGFRGRNVVELSDVCITVAPRPEADWEEGPALHRAYAAKKAQLSAAESFRQMSGAGATPKGSGGYGWSILAWAGRVLLNKLQFRMRRTHICFKVSTSSLLTQM